MARNDFIMKRTITLEEINKLNNKAWENRDIPDSKSYEIAKETLKKAKLLNYDKGIAESLHIISYNQAIKRAEYKQARANGQKALKIFVTNKDDVSKQKVLNTLGLIEGITGNLARAIEYFDRSLALANELNLDFERAKAYHNLAVAYEGVADYNTSLDYYLRAIKIYEDTGDHKNVYKSMQNIGVIYYNLEKYEEALDSLLKTVQAFKDSDDKDTRGLAYLNIGRSYFTEPASPTSSSTPT